MAATVPLYARPDILRGQQRAEAPAGRRRTTGADGRGGDQPVRSSMMPSESLLLSRPGSLLAQTASARRSVQPASSSRPSSPRPAMPGRQPRRRSPVRVHHALSTHPVSSSGIRQSSRPVSSPSGVRSPGFVVRGPAVRMADVHPSSVQLRRGRRRVGHRPPPRGAVNAWCPPCEPMVGRPGVVAHQGHGRSGRFPRAGSATQPQQGTSRGQQHGLASHPNDGDQRGGPARLVRLLLGPCRAQQSIKCGSQPARI
jgi:hypothetical protein